MFSALGSIFTTQPRHAESSDTRQDIRRHDPEHERRKKKKQFSQDDLLQNTDGATISVEALQLFLQSFLQSLADQSKQQFQKHAAQTDLLNQEDQNSQKASGRAAYAANAYQSMADTQQKKSLLERTDMDIDQTPPIALEASEVRKIHGLLEDLKILHTRNIEYIRIERGESFLQSLIDAVNLIVSAK